MSYFLSLAAFLLVPLAAVIWFIVSLVMCLKTPKTSEKRKTREILLFVSVIAAVALCLLPLLFLALLYISAISFM